MDRTIREYGEDHPYVIAKVHARFPKGGGGLAIPVTWVEDAQNNDDLLKCMVDRVLHGASTHDFVVKTITSGEVRTAARQFLPSHKGAYVRLALVGQ